MPIVAARHHPWFAVMLTLFTIIGVLVGYARYRTYIDGFDYSVFTQTIWHYSQFDAPSSSIRDVNNILGDHFHPLLIVLAPLFWVWNNPLVLIFVQPLLFATSALPLYKLALKHFGKLRASLIVGAYLLSHGLQFALYFDFHEIALAVPLVAWLIYYIDTQHYRRMLVCAALLCLVKEELVLLVAASGLVLILKKQKYKLGSAVFVGAIAFFGALTHVIMPAFAGKGRFHEYWTYNSYGTGIGDVIKNFFKTPFDFSLKLWHGLFNNSVKIDTLWVTTLTSGFTVFLSWYALLAVPDLLLRLLSDSGTFYWNYWFHYGAILMPILFFCFIDVLRRFQKTPKLTGILCVAIFVFNIGIMINKNFPFAQIFNSEFYNQNAVVKSGESRVHNIVGGSSSITAPVTITPHFANRETIRILTDKGRWYTDEDVLLTKEPDTQYVILNQKLPITDVEPYYRYDRLRQDIEGVGYKTIYDDQATGWVVYKK